MSRIENVPVEVDGERYLVTVGWDPPQRTYYAQVWRADPVSTAVRESARELEREGRTDAAADLLAAAEDSDAGAPVLWVGQTGRIGTVDALAQAIGHPYAEHALTPEVTELLIAHRSAGDASTVIDWRERSGPQLPHERFGWDVERMDREPGGAVAELLRQRKDLLERLGNR